MSRGAFHTSVRTCTTSHSFRYGYCHEYACGINKALGFSPGGLAILVIYLASSIVIKMAFNAPDIQALMLHLTWLCINVPHWINPRFRQGFPSLDHLSALLPEIGLSFCEGLFDIIQSATAPCIDWFLSLPTTIPNKTWGIYVLFLQKGKSFKLSVGSGTSTVNNGVRYRILQHKGRRVEPSLVKKAKARGYKQVHSSLLAWCSTPAPEHTPVFRTAIIALEAAFHLVFWPMNSRTASYNFPDGHWDRSAMTWEGLCHHNPLTEGVIDGVDNLDFTPEQLKHMAAVAADRRRAIGGRTIAIFAPTRLRSTLLLALQHLGDLNPRSPPNRSLLSRPRSFTARLAIEPVAARVTWPDICALIATSKSLPTAVDSTVSLAITLRAIAPISAVTDLPPPTFDSALKQPTPTQQSNGTMPLDIEP